MKTHKISALSMMILIVMLPIVEAQGTSTNPPSINTIQLTHGPQTVVTWATNIDATSQVLYGTTELDQNITKTDLETAHSITLPTTPGTTYKYKIVSCDIENRCASTGITTFIAGPFYVQANIPRYSRTTKTDIAGTTRPGATVTITVNGEQARKDIIDDGEFLFRNIQLQQTNTIIVKAELNEESAEQNYQIDVDNAPPLFNVTIPPVVTVQRATAKVSVSEPVMLTVEHGDNKTLTSNITAGQHDINVELLEGENLINFTAEDKAGFKSIAQERVIYDTGPPRFIEQNLRQLTPSYKRTVTVKGKISEKAAVTAFVNGKPQKTAPTADDGTFSIDIELERTGVGISPTGNVIGIDAAIAWKSKVKLEAVDAAGLKASTEEIEIEYAICGSGTWIDVQLTEPMPGTLNPRLLIEGMQQLGIAFNYTYRGGQKATINPRDVRIRKLTLAPEFQKDYDNGITSVSNPTVRTQRAGKPSGAGYIQVNFQPVDPWTLAEPDGKKEEAPSNATMYEKEKRISDHRRSTCLAPGLGCMKLFLELEIPFQEVTLKQTYDPQIQKTIEKEVPENLVQRTCVNVEVAIDERIPPKYVPSGFLKTLTKTLGQVIDGIDTVLKPIETIGKYLFYTCVAGQFISYVPIFLEKYNCQFTKYAALAAGEGGFDEKVAEIDACDEEYADNDDAKENCNSCADAKKTRKWYERTYTQICDRVMCPAAPSLQYYLKTKGSEKPTAVNAPNAAATTQYSPYLVDGKLMQGSDCAAWRIQKGLDEQAMKQREAEAQAEAERLKEGNIAPDLSLPRTFGETTPETAMVEGVEPTSVKLPLITGAQTTRTASTEKVKVPPRFYFTSQEINEIYENWLKHKDDSSSDDEETGQINCAKPHPAAAECCGYEYMQEWSSACGISALGGLDTFDEIKESTCLSAQKTGQNEIPGLDGTTQDCNSPLSNIFNSLGGFCTKGGGATAETLRVVPFQGAKGGQNTKLDQLGLATSKEKYMYLIMKPLDKNAKEWDLSLGYIVETVEFEQNPNKQNTKEEQIHEINAKLNGIELLESGEMQETFFSQTDMDAFYQGKEPTPGYRDFTQYLCEQAGYGPVTNCGADGEIIYRDVMAKIGTPDQEYIIRPNDGLINSIRCICFPTIIGYLKMWRNIMAAVRNCANTILVTGDGSEGVCQAVISKYACDLIYDVLTCFTQKFSTGQGRVNLGGGDIMGALTAAGSEMQRSTSARYGESSMYQTVFVEQKLVHSVCMWAFTGTWNFDLGAMFDTSVNEVPIDSVALITPCNRRFVAFNPSTQPGGLVTWLYHFGVGVAAGANLETELQLVCSNDFSCKESDGFERGKCDCQGMATPITTVIVPDNLPTRVSKNDILNEEVFYTIQGSPNQGKIRYDKAILKYRWKDGDKAREEEANCRISLTGGPSTVPNFCTFDLFTQSFRCRFGEQAGAIRIKGHTVGYNHALTTGQTHAIGENINVNLEIQQDYLGGDADTKHLQFKITAPDGREILTNEGRGLLPLNINGDYIKKIGHSDSAYAITIDRNWFAAGVAGQNFLASDWETGQAQATPSKYVQTASLTALGEPVRQPTYYAVELYQKDGKTKYKVHTAGQSKAVTATTGFGISQQPVCPEADASTTLSCYPAQTSTTGQALPSTQQLIVQLKSLPQTKTQIHLAFTPSTTTNPCEGQNRFRPQQFKMAFTAYDSDTYGQVTDQPSVDPLTGADATYTATFNAVCATPADLKPIELEQAGILPITKIISDLNTILTNAQAKENTQKTKFETYTGELNLAPKVNEIQTALDTFVSEEQTILAQLQPIKQTIVKQTIDLQSKPGQAVDETILAVKTPLNDLINGITLIITKAGQTRQAIQTANSETIRAQLQAFIADLTLTIELKKTTLASIQQQTGTALQACPDGQTVGGDYFACSETTLSAPWEQQTSLPCLGATAKKCYKLTSTAQCPAQDQPVTIGTGYYECTDQTKQDPWKTLDNVCLNGKKCITLPDTNMCKGEHYTLQNNNLYRFECKETQELGWETATEYILEQPPADPQTTFAATKVKVACLEPNKQCYKQSVYGATVTPEEQLALIRNIIEDFVAEAESWQTAYQGLAAMSDADAIKLLNPTGRQNAIREMQTLAQEIAEYAQRLDSAIKRPLSSGTSKVDSTITLYRDNLVLAGKPDGTLNKTAVQKMQSSTSPQQVKEAYAFVYVTLKPLVDNQPLSHIDYLFGVRPACQPDSIYQRKCFANSCPVAGTVHETSTDELGAWKPVNRDCGAGENCCERAPSSQTFIKEGTIFKPLYIPRYLTPNSQITLQHLVPYATQGEITQISYGDFDYDDDLSDWADKNIKYIPAANVNYNFNTNNQIAAIDIPQFTLTANNSWMFIEVLSGERKFSTRDIHLYQDCQTAGYECRSTCSGYGKHMYDYRCSGAGICCKRQDCGNGKLDPEEACDYGLVGGEYTLLKRLPWNKNTRLLGIIGIGVDIGAWCGSNDKLTEDCDDESRHYPDASWCSDDCKTLNTVIACIDADEDDLPGRAVFRVPFNKDNGAGTIEYVGSIDSTNDPQECKYDGKWKYFINAISIPTIISTSDDGGE